MSISLSLDRSATGTVSLRAFSHLRDLVYLHPKAASADTIAFVQKL